MAKIDKKIWYKANKRPVGHGRAVGLMHNHPNRARMLPTGALDRHGFQKYNVYIRRKGK